jgi:FKBP-type peptidyl-prolyl cis-trans isomerase
MRSRHWLAASLALLFAACGAPAQPPEPKLDTDDSKVIYALGVMIAQRLEGFAFTEPELATFESGLRDGVLGKEKKVDPASVEKQMQAFATARRQAMASAEKAAAAIYLDKMAAESGATKGPTGYVVRTITEGTGASPGPNDEVKVHYHGTLRDGTVFDSSVDRGVPAEFGLGHVVPCWTQALQTMKVGGKYKLTCPSDLAYGDRGSPPSIKPGAPLTFEIELLDVKPAAAPPAPPEPPHGAPAPQPGAAKPGAAATPPKAK